MTTTTADAVWAAVDDQRARTADLLERLTPAQWDHPSLCAGWTVGQVAAHLTLQQQRLGDVVAFVARHPRMLRRLTLNASIHESAVIQERLLPRQEVVDRIRAMIGSRRHNAFVTPLETLTDVLVHSQDVAVPLGLDLRDRPGGRGGGGRAVLGHAETPGSPRSSAGSRSTGTGSPPPTPTWTRGEGPEVAGPAAALLLLVTGRDVALDRLTGEGAAGLRSALAEAR